MLCDCGKCLKRMHVDWDESHSGPTEWVPAKLLADRDAEIERLRADLVWSSKRVVRWDGDGFLYHTRERPFSERDSKWIRHDGTPESICRAVREARGDGVS